VGKRVFSTVVLWTILFVTVWFFHTAGAVVLLAALTALTLREFYRLQEAAGRAPFPFFGIFFGVLITVAPWVEARFGPPAHPLIALAVVVLAIRILGERAPEARVDALSSTIFGLVYIALLLQYLVRILTPLPGDSISADGRLILCIWLVAVAKFCDTGALLTGMAFGRHALAPQISPKKTWEGAAGGIAAGALVGAGIAWLARGEIGAFLPPARAAVIAVPIAIVAIISDLVESVIKRHAALKDSGAAIPGIGGIFDMMDSILLAAPVGYFLFGLH